MFYKDKPQLCVFFFFFAKRLYITPHLNLLDVSNLKLAVRSRIHILGWHGWLGRLDIRLDQPKLQYHIGLHYESSELHIAAVTSSKAKCLTK